MCTVGSGCHSELLVLELLVVVVARRPRSLFRFLVESASSLVRSDAR